MKRLFVFLLFLKQSMILAQVPNVDWMKRYGGLSTDLVRSLIATEDGGFLLGGYSNSGISGVKSEDRIGFTPDYWVVKTDGQGNIEWQKTIGGGMPFFLGDLEADVLNKVSQSIDGGFFLAGNSDSPEFGSKTVPNYGMQDYWIVKINSVGDIVWQTDLGGSDYDECYAVEATLDGGCIVGGYSKSDVSGNKTQSNKGLKDYWVVKLDVNGQIQWQKTYGGISDDILHLIKILENDEYILVGVSASDISGDKTENSKGGGDFWILKIDNQGSIIWQKTIGGDNVDEPFNLVQLENGYLLGGYSRSNISFDKSEVSRGGADYWLVKTDFDGNVLWDKTLGGDLDDYLRSFIFLQDESGFLLTGGSYSGVSGDKTVQNYGSYNGWIIKIDINGNLIWQKGLGGDYIDSCNQVIQLPDQTLVLGGVANSNISGNITVAGYGGNDYWLIKLSQEQLNILDFSINKFLAYPNPTTGDVNLSFFERQEKLEVIVFNSLMQTVDDLKFENTSSMSFSINGPPGYYFIVVTDYFGKSYPVKLVKM